MAKKSEKTLLLEIVNRICEELDCSIIDFASALQSNVVTQEIGVTIHWQKYGKSPKECLECRTGNPHIQF